MSIVRLAHCVIVTAWGNIQDINEHSSLSSSCDCYCHFPLHNKSLYCISDCNYEGLLFLAREYQMDRLTRNCDNYLCLHIGNVRSNYTSNFQYLVLADKYQLIDFLNRCISKVACYAIKTIEADESFHELSDKACKLLFRKKLSIANIT